MNVHCSTGGWSDRPAIRLYLAAPSTNDEWMIVAVFSTKLTALTEVMEESGNLTSHQLRSLGQWREDPIKWSQKHEDSL